MTATPGHTATLKKAVLLSQVLAVFPYSCDGGQFLFSLPRVIWLLTMTGVLVLFLVMNSVFPAKEIFDSEFDWQIASLKLVVVCCSCCGMMLAMLWTRPRLEAWSEALYTAERTVAFFLKIHFRYRIAVPLANILFLIVLIVSDLNIYDAVSYLKVFWGYYLSAFITVAFINEFVGLVEMLAQALKDMNDGLAKTTVQRIEASVMAYERITAAAEQLNEAYGTQLLLTVGANFLLSTTNAFLVVNEDDLLRKFIYSFWCLFSAIAPLRIVHACMSFIYECKEFNVILASILVEQKNGEVAENAKLRLHMSMKKEIEFTARGFFPLDYGLIIAMLGAVTTYLVILIQFDNSGTR